MFADSQDLPSSIWARLAAVSAILTARTVSRTLLGYNSAYLCLQQILIITLTRQDLLPCKEISSSIPVRIDHNADPAAPYQHITSHHTHFTYQTLLSLLSLSPAKSISSTFFLSLSESESLERFNCCWSGLGRQAVGDNYIFTQQIFSEDNPLCNVTKPSSTLLTTMLDSEEFFIMNLNIISMFLE